MVHQRASPPPKRLERMRVVGADTPLGPEACGRGRCRQPGNQVSAIQATQGLCPRCGGLGQGSPAQDLLQGRILSSLLSASLAVPPPGGSRRGGAARGTDAGWGCREPLTRSEDDARDDPNGYCDRRRAAEGPWRRRTSGQGAGRKERQQAGRDQPRPGGVRLECRGTRGPAASDGD